MKEIYNFITLSIGVAMLALLISGCGEKCSGCPENVELSDLMKLRIPYQEGQMVKFAKASGDTMLLSCVERAYYQQETRPMERPESECCPSYSAENVACLLSGENGDFIRVRTDYSAYYSITIAGSLRGLDFNIGSFKHKIDSIEIYGQIFMNVSISEENNDEEISVFLGNDGKGIVGFIINGEEWALVE